MSSPGPFWSFLTYVSLSPDLTAWQGNLYCLVLFAASPHSTENSRLVTTTFLLPTAEATGAWVGSPGLSA